MKEVITQNTPISQMNQIQIQALTLVSLLEVVMLLGPWGLYSNEYADERTVANGSSLNGAIILFTDVLTAVANIIND